MPGSRVDQYNFLAGFLSAHPELGVPSFTSKRLPNPTDWEIASRAYMELAEKLMGVFKDEPDKTLRRKLARQAARSVLPNATETKIFVSANARALRHFIEMRGSRHAEVEIRKLAVQVLRVMRQEAPHIFGDYELVPLPDGTLEAITPHRKV